ncbi:MAG: short-subunit dehydrogenase [Pseudohongiellaceae bacterium]|jgi:short-subunit dehydrogenase
MNSYKGKTALITGASSGIGLAMAHELSKRGAIVIMAARSRDKLDMEAQVIRQNGNQAHTFTTDLSLPNSAEKLYGEIISAGLNIDLLVNNAGYGRWGDFTEFDREDYGLMIQLNITSLTDLCHLAIPDMISKGGGGIINVGSTASFVPVPYSAVYGASKAYVLMFSESIRYEYADQHINVMALCPGATKSNFSTVATANSSVELQKLNAKIADDIQSGETSEEVAVEGLDAFLQNKSFVLTGKSNKKMGIVPRFLTRKKMLKIVGDGFRKRVLK